LSQDETESGEDEAKTIPRVTLPHETRPLTVEEKSRVRRWVRVPTEGLLSGALWPLLAFLLLLGYGVTAFARGSVEGVVRERVRAALAGQGLGFASVEVSGQNVVLRGQPPAAADADRALLVAERATCATFWFGERDCTIDVRGEFQPVSAAPAAPDRPTAAQADTCDREFADLLSRSRIEFETSRADIRPASRPLLEELGAAAARCPGRLRVEGHTDDRGAEEANLRLSRERAEAVCRAFVKQGIEPKRLVPEGLGETRPIAPNTTADGRARNRRIEIRVVRE
jgi:outer membrane protein OmpA-like peptidoglycan-associated protein